MGAIKTKYAQNKYLTQAALLIKMEFTLSPCKLFIIIILNM